MTPSSQDFSIQQIILNTQRAWWLVTIAILLGGLVGFCISLLRPPEYEASFDVAMSIDYTRTGPISQYDEDHALGMAGTLIYSAQVMEEVIRIANEQGIQIDYQQLLDASSIERRAHVWKVRVRNQDSEQAYQLASLWSTIGIKQLQDAYRHALAKEQLERQATSLASCLEQAVPESNINSFCSTQNLLEVQSALEALQNQIATEAVYARNIFPGIVFDEVIPPVKPGGPRWFGRGSMVTAGAAIGFVLAIIGLTIGIPTKSLKRRHEANF